MIKIDRDLLFLHSEDARGSIRKLSQILNKSPQRLKYSLRQLEKDKIVNNVNCIFDYSYFGLVLFRVYFKGGYVGESDKAEIIRKLSENPYVVTMYELNGEFDLAIDMESPNPSRFNKELKKIIDLIPTLNNYKVILNLVTYLYPRSYLVKNNDLLAHVPQETIIGGDRDIAAFDKKEMAVMKCLLANPRIRLTELARRSNLNAKTAVSILKDLQKRKIIKGFKYLIDTNKLDIYKFRLFLKLHNASQEREAQLMDYMLKTKEIFQINKTVGDWDMEIDISSPDKTAMRHLIIQIRERFNDLIETFNIIEFYQYYKKSYLPQYLFNEESI